MPAETDLLLQLDDILVAYAKSRLAQILDGQRPAVPKLAPPKRATRAARAKTAPTGRGAKAVKAAPKPKARKLTAAMKATNELKRVAGTKPVACPVEGCRKPGVRNKMNFCVDHAASLPKAEKKKLRAAQIAKAAKAAKK